MCWRNICRTSRDVSLSFRTTATLWIKWSTTCWYSTDREIFVNQQKKIAAFNAYVKKNAIASVGIIKAEPTAHEEAAPPPPLELPLTDIGHEMEVSYHIPDPLADL